MEIDERGAAVKTRARRRRVHDDEGAAVVEMALVGSLLFLLVFGIIGYGYAMSERQNMTEAAADGARAAAVTTQADAKTTATAATNQAVSAFGKTCSSDGLTCVFAIAPCTAGPVESDQAVAPGNKPCLTVTLHQATSGTFYKSLPLISAFFPETMTMQSVVEINP